MKYSDIAILYRTNAQAGPIQRHLSSKGIPYKCQGGMGFWQQREVKDIIAFLSWCVNPLDTMSLERASKNLKLGVGQSVVIQLYRSLPKGNLTLDQVESNFKIMTATKLSVLHSKFKRVLNVALNVYNKPANIALTEFYNEFNIVELLTVQDSKDPNSDICRVESAATLLGMAKDMSIQEFIDSAKLDTSEDDNTQDAVLLSTVHRSKGLEWDLVMVVGCSDGIFPSKMVYADIEKNHKDIETRRELEDTSEYRQEINAMYVAQTRAKKYLLMLHTIEHAVFRGKSIEDSRLSISPLLIPCAEVVKEKGVLNLSDESLRQISKL